MAFKLAGCFLVPDAGVEFEPETGKQDEKAAHEPVFWGNPEDGDSDAAVDEGKDPAISFNGFKALREASDVF